MPEGGSGRVLGSREGGGWRGWRRVVMAWTLVEYFVSNVFYQFLESERERRLEGWDAGESTHGMSLLVLGNRLYSVYSTRPRSRAGRSAPRLY